MQKTGICRLVIFAAIVVLACQAWANPVTVLVVDADGKSVAGATVSELAGIDLGKRESRTDTSPVAIGITDTRGTIHLDCDPSERSAFLVAAPDRAPRTFGFWGCVPPRYLLALQRISATYSGRIIDATSDAMGYAPMRIRIRNYELLDLARVFNSDYPPITYDLASHTDAHGRFNMPAPLEGSVQSVDVELNGAWHSTMAPDADTDAAIDALKDGSYIGRADPAALAANSQPATRPAAMPTLVIHLRVVDAATNQPIKNIRVIPGGCRSPDQLFRTLWSYALNLPGSEATWTFYDDAWAYFLRVESDGYAAAPTRIVKASEKNVDVEVRLIKARPLSISVRTPTGHPAAGASAYLSTPTIDLGVPSLTPRWDDSQPIAAAGDDGVIHFVPPNEPYRLAIEQAEGSAEISGTDLNGKPIVLDRWASADIHLGSAKHPLGRAFIEPQSGISELLHCPVNWGGVYRSDANGDVTIAAWRPGDFRTTIILPRATAKAVGWNYLELSRELKPGEHVNLPVLTGATTVQASLSDYPGCKWSMLWISPAGPATQLPPNVNRLSGKAQNAAVEKAELAAPDPHAEEDVIGEIPLPVPDNGRVSVAGLRPGTYVLGGYVMEMPSARQLAYTLNWYFSVPASAPAVVDLGAVSPVQTDPLALRIGQFTPDLVATTLDGKRFSLKSLRGRWVLLDFWGTWCGICIAEESSLKDAFEGWSRDGRLAMVSASVDDTVEQVRQHVEANKLPWTQLILGPRAQTKMPETFGVNGYPSIMLISPRGQVIETGLGGIGLRDALIKYLGPPAPPDGKH